MIFGRGPVSGQVQGYCIHAYRVGTWVGKPAYLATNSLTIQEGQQEIIWVIPECQIKVRGPGHPHVNLLTPQPFRFDQEGDFPQKDTPRDANSDHQLSPCWPLRGWNHNWHRRNQGLPPPQPPLPSLDCRFESDRSSVLTASSMSSLSDRSEGSWCPQQGRWCGETRAHMKINLPVFKDEDTKDTLTYQSWRWDLMVYHHTGCRDHTLLTYAIWSLQHYPRELVRSSEMDVTLDDMLTILDEHYINVKALDALDQELFQLWMADKETNLDWGICLSIHLHVLATSFPNHFPPNHVAELRQVCFYGRLPKQLKAMVACLKASPTKRLIVIPFGLQGKWKRKNPWSYPKTHRARHLITLINQKLLVSSLLGSSKGTNQYLKWLPCTWHTWKRKVPKEMRKWKAKTLTVLMGLWKSSWYTWQGLWRMPK